MKSVGRGLPARYSKAQQNTREAKRLPYKTV